MPRVKDRNVVSKPLVFFKQPLVLIFFFFCVCSPLRRPPKGVDFSSQKSNTSVRVHRMSARERRRRRRRAFRLSLNPASVSARRRAEPCAFRVGPCAFRAGHRVTCEFFLDARAPPPNVFPGTATRAPCKSSAAR